MERHLTHKQVAQYLAQTTDADDRERVARHLAECAECRKRHELLKTAMTPRFRAAMPGAAVKAGVMRSWEEEQQYGTGAFPFSLRSLRARHPRIALAASLAVMAAAITLGLFLLRTPPTHAQLALSADRIDEGVSVNDRAARPLQRILPASTVRIPEMAMARLSFGKNLAITLSGPAIFSIDRFEREETSGRILMECTLSDGVLVSSVNSRELSIAYAFNTPGARIEPLGTEFLLQSAGSATLVVVKQGSVLIKPVKSPETAAVSAGSRCVVRDKAVSAPAAQEDLNIFNDLDGLGAGKYAPRLITDTKGGRAGLIQSERNDDGADMKRTGIPAGNKLDMNQPDGEVTESGPGKRRERAERPAVKQIKKREPDNEKRQALREAVKARRENVRERRKNIR